MSHRDCCVHQLLSHAGTVSLLVDAFGNTNLNPDGTVNRAALRALIFGNCQLKQRLESILHPLVFAAMKNAGASAMKRGAKVFVAEVPLFYETSPAFRPDLTVLVAARSGLQTQRIVNTRGLTAEIAASVIQAQLPLEDKIALADVVVWNEGDPALLTLQARLLIQQIEEHHVY